MNIYHCHLSVPGKKPPVTGVEQQPLFFNFFFSFVGRRGLQNPKNIE
jgi:hypothetical protein